MSKVSDILSRKGSKTVSLAANAPVIEAIRLMAENNVGSVLVMDQDEYLGLVTERDYTRKVILVGKNSTDTKVNEIMSSDLPRVKADDSIDHCMELMSNSNIRYLPVFEDNRFKAIISMTDVVKETIIRQKETINHLDNYIRS